MNAANSTYYTLMSNYNKYNKHIIFIYKWDENQNNNNNNNNNNKLPYKCVWINVIIDVKSGTI